MSNPASSIARVESFEARFEGFEDLPKRSGHDYVESPEFTCFGHQWCVRIFPGGDGVDNPGMVSPFLVHKSRGCIAVEATFILIDENCASYKHVASHVFGSGDSDDTKFGPYNFAERTKIIDALMDGALVVNVQLKQTGSSLSSAAFVPENPCSKNILSKYLDEESADVVFEVSSSDQAEEGGRKARKRAKASPAVFHAHKFILQQNAPALGEACNLKEGKDDPAPIPINGVTPEIFRIVLYYVYGGKLEAEACYVKATEISIDNVIENLIYADAMNCSLLKEAVMDFLVENGAEVIEKVSLKDAPEGLLADLLTAMSQEKKKGADKGNGLRMMRVSELRRKLDEKGLEVDGSREAMIARLEESS